MAKLADALDLGSSSSRSAGSSPARPTKLMMREDTNYWLLVLALIVFLAAVIACTGR